MPPKRKPKKRKDRFRCDEIEGERFHAHTDDVFRFNWWEVFCFPYILCARVWDCCVSMCSGTNQCLVYWMMIQWVVCKITKITTPDPILFPYYFYLFCQVIILTACFVCFWYYLGKPLFFPYFQTLYTLLAEDEMRLRASSNKNTTRLSFRRYCFRKGEIFESSFNNRNDASFYSDPSMSVALAVLQTFLHGVLNL